MLSPQKRCVSVISLKVFFICVMDRKYKERLHHLLINPNHVNDEDIMNTSFETTKLLFEQNKKDELIMCPKTFFFTSTKNC